MSDLYFTERTYLTNIIGIIDKSINNLNLDKKKSENRIFKERKYMREELPSQILSFDDANALALQNAEIQSAEQSFLEKARRLHMLIRMRSTPYFGRIDFKELKGTEHKVYIGISNLTDEDDYSTLICDWRAPIASLFYENGTGYTSYESPDGDIYGYVSLLRQYKIENSILEFVIDSDIKIDDMVLLSALSKNSSSHMKNIVSTIQREQNSIIRDSNNDLLIVLGPAGSGKTNIALHRLAYL